VLGAAAWADSVHVEAFIWVEREDYSNTRSLPPAPHLRTTCRNQREAPVGHNNRMGWCVISLGMMLRKEKRGTIVKG
jgi:hypothetical protein